MGGSLNKDNGSEGRAIGTINKQVKDGLTFKDRYSAETVKVDDLLHGNREETTYQTTGAERMSKSRDFYAQQRKAQKERNRLLEEIYETCELTRWQRMVDQIKIRRYQAVKFVFLLVVAGCEIDLLAFGTAWWTYWQAGIAVDAVMCVFLIVGPLGYLGSLALYANQNWTKDVEDDVNQDDEELEQGPLAQGLAGGDPVEFCPRQRASEKDYPAKFMLRTALLQKDPVELQLYHFVPLIRMYLLVKDKTRGDVESVFCVYGLSTFTIGLAQMACIALGVLKKALDFNNLFVQIGLYAQCINLVIIGIDCSTYMCDTLKTSIEIDNLVYQEREKRSKELVAFDRAIRLASEEPENAVRAQHVQLLHRMVEQEIQHLTSWPHDITWVPYRDKIELRRLLQTKLVLCRI